MPKSNQCVTCLYFAGNTCFAYPERIPYEIISGQMDHNAILPGQVGDYIWREFSESALTELLEKIQKSESE